MNAKEKENIYKLTSTALMTAILCVISPYAIPIPISQTPITLATFAVYLASIILGWKMASMSVLVYILIGIVGVPVFSGFGAGIQKIVGPTGGYLLGYLAITLIAGWFSEKQERKITYPVIGMVLGTLVMYFMGTAWMKFSLHMSWKAAFLGGVLPYIPLDVLKIAAATAIGYPIKNQIKKMLQASSIIA